MSLIQIFLSEYNFERFFGFCLKIMLNLLNLKHHSVFIATPLDSLKFRTCSFPKDYLRQRRQLFLVWDVLFNTSTPRKLHSP